MAKRRPEHEDGGTRRPRATGTKGTKGTKGAKHAAAGDNTTPDGAPSKATQGYGVAQGASGATSGGADPGGSVNIPS